MHQQKKLRRRVNGSVALGCKPGPSTILSDEEEHILCKYIIELGDMGYGLMKQDVQWLVFFSGENELQTSICKWDGRWWLV